MKYIITLRRTMEKKVVIEATDLEEVDSKLADENFVFETERTISPDVYSGWNYQPHIIKNIDQNCLPVDSEDEVICSLEDFARWCGCGSIAELERHLFNHTDCGMCYSADPISITLVGYVEGADCEHPTETLLYPFTGRQVRDVIARLEEEADEMWHEWNDCGEEQ